MTFSTVRRAVAMAAALATVAVAATAHHSHGNYEMTDFTNLQGVVKELHLMNPHSWVYLE